MRQPDSLGQGGRTAQPGCSIGKAVLAHAGGHGAGATKILSAYWDHLGPVHMTDDDMRAALWYVVAKLSLQRMGFLESRVGTHSLRAGGALALKLVGADRDNIKNMGR